ncbi:class 3 adenylate cyclase/tetratricopeptide (TPR) repeat protein [Actinokineospora baliensis]|uniref:AAA family ATPase n=1 Tax=Actinokineospora baliensis TaxID=547056 RepID=UPI00195A9E10|nr:AAA family ATPase [Actinokineospora baliensis]MBM7774724.1 class 3 adenylate cyclase/tetratricopeptide (TPR) repeat protein [Actinokineospora baliensis]
MPPYVLRRLSGSGLPDLPAARRLRGAVMVADVSGFTALCERLAARGPDGVDVLSRALNRYYARLIDVIGRHGGEVVNFAGDALVALWESGAGDLAAAAHNAKACAAELAAGKPTGRIRLVTRFGIGAGELCGVELGGVGGRRHCVLDGAALAAASVAGRLAGVGRVGLAPELAELPDRPAVLPGAVVPAELPPIDVLRPYLPATVLARLAHGQRSWLAELRTVTALFMHVPGFDAVADTRRAHEVVRISQHHLGRRDIDLLDVSVDDHGTCLVAVAGLPPFAHGEDAARAIDAARALTGAITPVAARPSIGIATGRAFCGPVGGDHRATYTVIGDVMNTAARLMQHGATGDGSLLCDAETERVARYRHGFGAAHALRVKGKRDVLPAYEPNQPPPAPIDRSNLPIVGRHRARRALTAALADAAAGTARVVLVEGEPGIGKSRLLAELPSIAAARGARLLTGAADHLERGTPYRGWRSVFADLAAAAPADSAPLLNGVLDRDVPETPMTAALRGERRTDAVRRLLVDLVRAAAARGPLVVALDDVHWLDSASWALVRAVSSLPVPLLVVIAGRPVERTLPDHARVAAAARVIVLGPLAAPDLIALVRARLGTPEVPPPLAASIAERSGGNPLLAEELLAALREAGVVRVGPAGWVEVETPALAALPVPHTVEGVLGSRINGLGPTADLVLKVASVLGQAFDRTALGAVHPARAERADLDVALADLVRRELLVPAGADRFAFRHALTRDVAYHRMLTRQRRGLHRRVAGWLENRGATGGVADHALLGHHWDRAGARDRASAHLRLASIRAVNEGMGAEAVHFGLRAVELLGVAPRRDGVAEGIRVAEAAIAAAAGGDLVRRLEALPASTNARMTTVVGLLLAIEPAVFMNQQIDLYNLIGLWAMRLTLRYGADQYTPGVIAVYAVLDQVPLRRAEAFALTSLARRMAARADSPLVSYTGFVHSVFVHHWLRPIATNLRSMARDARSGFDRGEDMLGCFNIAGYVVLLARAGASVPTVLAAGRRGAALVGGRVTASAFHCVLEIQVARALAGETTEPWSLTDPPGFDGVGDIAAIVETDLYNQIAYYWTAKARLLVYYRRYAEAVACARRAEPLLPAITGQIEESEFTLWYALALLGRGHQGDRESATDLLARLRSWSQDAPDRLEHKALLVEGRLAGQPRQAQAVWAAAAESAMRAGHRQHAAFAWELAGRTPASVGDPKAAHYLDLAHACYRRLGAWAKVTDLQSVTP